MSEIVWKCEICEEPVADHDGWVTISYARIAEYEKAKRAWREANPGPVHNGRALLDYPETPRWHVWHKKCDPDIESADYTIDIDRIRTHEKVISWTAHLLEKSWFPHTNWPTIIRRTINQAEISV